VVTVTVAGSVTVAASVGGGCEVSVGVVGVVAGVVGVAVERVGSVGVVRVVVRVAIAAVLPPPPHDESAKPEIASRTAEAASPNGRAAFTTRMISRRPALPPKGR